MRRQTTPAQRFSKASQCVLALLLVGFVWLQLVGVLHKYVHMPSVATESAGVSVFEKVFPEHTHHDHTTCIALDAQCASLALLHAVCPLVFPLFFWQPIGHNARAVATLSPPAYRARGPPRLI